MFLCSFLKEAYDKHDATDGSHWLRGKRIKSEMFLATEQPSKKHENLDSQHLLFKYPLLVDKILIINHRVEINSAFDEKKITKILLCTRSEFPSLFLDHVPFGCTSC